MSLITADQVKQFLQLSSVEHDALLQDLADRASAVAEHHCDRTFAVGTYTPAATPDDALLDGKGLPFVYTPQWPIVSVTSLALVQDGGGATVRTFAAGEFGVYRRDGKISLLSAAGSGQRAAGSGAPVFPAGLQNVAVSYVAGYATIPADLQEAVVLIAAHMFGLSDQRRLMATSIAVGGGGAGGMSTFKVDDMPPEARARLDRYRAVVPR